MSCKNSCSVIQMGYNASENAFQTDLRMKLLSIENLMCDRITNFAILVVRHFCQKHSSL